jgi:tetratricopeptide (TPR) repeat protein
MSWFPLDDNATPGIDSVVLQHADVREDSAGRLRTSELDFHEVRDLLWLAEQLCPERQPLEQPAVGASADPAAEPSRPRADRDAAPDDRPVSTDPPQGETSTSGGRRELQDWSPGQPRTVRSTMVDHDQPEETGPLLWPSAPALSNSRRIARALRPMCRNTPSPFRQELDEEQTADRSARGNKTWQLVFRPALWHEFELVVLVDTAGAMAVWDQTVRELCDLFRRQGAFRNVRTLFMDCSRQLISLHTTRSATERRGWRDEVDPTGRRIFLILTDGIGDAWRNGAAIRLAANWARSAPVAVVNVLPQRLWAWGGLSPRRIRLSAPAPGSPNRRLRMSATADDPFGADGPTIPIPVLGLEPEWWSNWARLIAVPGSGWVDSTAVLVGSDVDTADVDSPEEEDLPPRERVLRFRTFASVEAFQLAGLLAAAPLSLSTMKLVQRVLLPGSGLEAVSEVLLGGLLTRARVQPDPADSSVAAYEFHEGVREELLASGRRADTIRVARLLGDHLSAAIPALRNFRDALDDPENTPEPDKSESGRQYVKLQEVVFRALSGRYAPRAKRLRALSRVSPDVPTTTRYDSAYSIEHSVAESPAIVRDSTAAELVASSALPEAHSPLGGEVSTTGYSHSPEGAARQPRVWGSVPLRNPDFVGREDLLENLRMRLTEPGGATAVLPEALHGMGGVGKSQTVVEYIYRHAAEYDIIWWIPAEHTTQIRSSFVELARKLGVPVGSTADTAVPAVLEALRNGEPYRRWILVFDNADRPDVVREFLPAGIGHVVVTSRNSEWAGVARTVEVDLFTREESKELLRRRGGDISDSDADLLAEALGDLPLAVEQAASWRAQTGMPVDEYLRLMEENSSELLKAGATGNYELPVAAAWNVPLNRLRADRREALELLQVCAFFGPEPISRSLFIGGRGTPVPDALQEAFADPIRLNHAIREISRYSLAKIDHRNNTLQLHRLVQTVLRDQLDPNQQDNMRRSVHQMLVNGDPNDPDLPANWQTYADLLPHAVNSRAVESQDKWVRTMVNNMVRYLLAAGDYHGALQLAEQALEVRTAVLGENDLDTLVMGRHYGTALRRVGRVTDATEVNKRTYEKMIDTLGEDHEATIDMADTFAFVHRFEGRLFEELELAESIFERARRVLGDEDPATLFYANNLAASLRLAGEFFRARALDVDTLRRREVVLGADHVHTLNTACGLAMDIRECGFYLEACEMQEQTSARFLDLFGLDHPTSIGSNRCLAVARCKAGMHDKAMELTEDCYNRYRIRHGADHLDTVTSLMVMTTELRHLGDLARSRELGEQGVRQFEQVYFSEHPFALVAVTNLAITLRLLGEVEEARRLNERALAGFREYTNDDHPFTLVAATNLASDLAELGDVERAYRLDTDTLERSTRKLGEEHPSTLALAHNLSIDLNLLGQSDEAAALHTKTVANLTKSLGEDHPATVAAIQNLRANCDSDTMQL